MESLLMVDRADDEKVVSRKKQKAVDVRRNHLRVLERLLGDAPGRQFIWGLLTKGHVFSQTVDFASHARMCFAEGERTVALEMLTDIVTRYPSQYMLMTKENAPVDFEEEENAGTDSDASAD
jgi:hypothetical protein